MDDPKDLHICGHCRKIFDNVELFITHKSGCNPPKTNPETQLNDQIILGSEIFSSVDLIDPTALQDGTFPLILQYENEEVVGDTSTKQFLVYDENLNDDLPSFSIQSSENVNSEGMSEDDIANLLITQLSKEVVKKSKQLQTNIKSNGETSKALLEERADSVDLMKYTIENELEFCEEAEVGENVSKKKERFPCSICNFVPMFPRDLVRHMRKHTGERPYICNICDKKFARQDKLFAHSRIHTGVKPYKCQLCEYASSDGPALRKHMRTHTDDRPYKCQLCSYAARNSSHMIIHLRKHTGDSPFFCQLENCGLTFKTSSDLKKHKEKHKQDSLSPYSSFDDMSEKCCSKHLFRNGKLVNKLSCYACQDYVYGGPTNRKQKVRKKSKKRAWLKKAHECPHCNAAFVRPDSLRSHMRLHQQEETRLADKPLVQDEEEPEKEANCSVSQSSQSVLAGDTSNVPEVFYVDNGDCLQDSLIAIGQDGTIQSIVNTSLL